MRAGGITLGRVGLIACLCAVACQNDLGRRGATGQVGLGTGPTSESDSEIFDCRRIEVPAELGWLPDIVYTGMLEDVELGDPVIPDAFTIEIRDGAEGGYDLGDGDNQSYSSCGQCVLVSVDAGTKWYFQESGRLEIDPGSRPSKGFLETDLVDIRLVEVEIDEESWATEVVEGGDCLEIVDLEINELKVEDWTCASGFYGALDGCDCGCGVTDPDCDSEARGVCDFCNAQGSCSEFGGDCPGAIDADDNAICDVVSAWSCDMALYDAGDGTCDCGCGLVDPDCNGRSGARACDTCTEPGSCVEGDPPSCIGVINGVNNGSCTPVNGWTCNPTFYAANDGCDCGCGLKDPDCSGGEVDVCEYCGEVGSCAQGELDCASIDQRDTGSCS